MAMLCSLYPSKNSPMFVRVKFFFSVSANTYHDKVHYTVVNIIIIKIIKKIIIIRIRTSSSDQNPC